MSNSAQFHCLSLERAGTAPFVVVRSVRQAHSPVHTTSGAYTYCSLRLMGDFQGTSTSMSARNFSR